MVGSRLTELGCFWLGGQDFGFVVFVRWVSKYLRESSLFTVFRIFVPSECRFDPLADLVGSMDNDSCLIFV